MKRPAVIAFHGDMPPWAWGKDRLRKDMGDPSFVDHYFAGHDFRNAVHLCSAYEKVFLIGYSRGGSLIGDLTYILPNIAGVVLYEAPLLNVKTIDYKNPKTDNFPVWSLWNKSSRRSKSKEGQDTIYQWRRNRTKFELIDTLKGRGHIHWWPFPAGHAWDTGVNYRIKKWIKQCTI